MPIGHSLGSLFVDLRALWQHMFYTLAFMGTQGGIRRPKGLKVTPLHPVLCAMTIVKTDASTTHHFLCKLAQVTFE